MNQRKKNHKPFLGKLLTKIAPRIGARVIMEPRWNVVGQIIFKNGKKRYFRYTSIDLNSLGSSEISKDKDYSTFFLKGLGYPTIVGKTFYSNKWGKIIGDTEKNIDTGFKYAKKIGFPVVVKPNNGSQGNSVSFVHNKEQYYQAMNRIFKTYNIALVQERLEGKDYRIVVIDKKIISAYKRIPLNVVGDGKSSIKKLLKTKERKFETLGRDTRIDLADPRIEDKLSSENLTWNSIPKKGEQIFLLNNANLSTGGDALDVTSEIHPSFKKIAVDITRDMGLRLCGVDLMIEGDISKEATKYKVIETNAAPGLDHYVTNGKEQEKIVEDLYLEVLKHMGK